MSLSTDTRRRLAAILKQSLEADEPIEQTLSQLASEAGADRIVFEAIGRLLRRQKLQDVARSRDSWFKALGWYFARLFMWGSVIAAAGAYLLVGARAADPLTWALGGAMGYYVLIQVCTPVRLRAEAGHLSEAERAERENIRQLITALDAENDRP